MTDESVQTPGPIPDSYWLIEGQLLAGEYPGAPRDDEARRKLEAILRAGVRSFIDLTEMNDPLEPCEVPAPRPARAPPLSFDTRARHGRRGDRHRSLPNRRDKRRAASAEQHFSTVEELRQALLAFKETYNREWPITRLGYRSPAQVRQAFAVRPAA